VEYEIGLEFFGGIPDEKAKGINHWDCSAAIQ
jgi:hypothetical protein